MARFAWRGVLPPNGRGSGQAYWLAFRVVSSRSRRRVVISGRVQGVWFRDTLRRRAERHGVAGWARNTSAGTVEALLEGPEDAVEEMVAWCWIGPPDAHVDDVQVTVEQPQHLSGFEVRW